MIRNTTGSETTRQVSDRARDGGADPAGEGAAFWRFSLALYARPGVADALIALQDRAGLDVNLILFGLWVGARHGGDLGPDGFAAAAASVAGLNRVVRDIRALRRRLADTADDDMTPAAAKSDPSGRRPPTLPSAASGEGSGRGRRSGSRAVDSGRSRRALLSVELAAERRVQVCLAAGFTDGSAAGTPPYGPADRHRAALANLARSLGNESGSPEAAVLRLALAGLTRRG